ncbi:MAG: UbiA prenyltransferase family protein [Planctomycetales bacterium]|nr:UbiA prenyltransferase family protein [Planctomycetales bacterium]
MGDAGAAGRSLAAAAAFSLLAAGVYLANDVRDAAEDRRHPARRVRPVASGDLPVGAAVFASCALVLAGLALALGPGWAVAAFGAGYLALSAAYTLVLRRIPVLDVAAVAGGFLLRILAGAAAVPCEPSRWIVLCGTLLALFLATAKRRAEQRALGAEARAVLALYPRRLLDAAVAATGAAALAAYAFYTVAPDTVARFGTRALGWTVLPVAAGIGRYAWLGFRRGAGETPGRTLLRDPTLLGSVLLWIGLCAWVIYGR